MPKTSREPSVKRTATTKPTHEQAIVKTSALQDAICNSRYFSSIATDAKGVIQIFNKGAEQMLGYSAGEVVNKLTPADISDKQELNARATALSLEFSLPIAAGFESMTYKAARGIEDIYQLTYIRKNGTRFQALLSVTALRDDHEIIGYLLIANDNTARALAEQLELVKTLEQHLFKYSHDALIVLVPPLWQVSAANQAALQIFGTSSLAEFCALWPGAFAPERQNDGQLSQDKTLEMIAIALTDGYSYYEWQSHRLDGVAFSCDVLLTRIEVDGANLVQLSVRDISVRKQAEIALKHALRALATLGAVNSQLVHATDETELLQAICQVVVKQPGYLLAWVGYVQADVSQTIKIMASASASASGVDYLQALRHMWAENEPGQFLSERAVRSGATQLCQDITQQVVYLPWREKALQCGYASCIALALKNEQGEVFASLNVYADEAHAFIKSEIKLLEDTAADLAYGIQALRIRQQRDQALLLNQQQLAQLEVNLEDTVRAIATIVEMRDPYTSGHQVRVAHLAAAIASKMGLPVKQVHGIHLAAMVHDLGKMQVPAEILSKPGVISDIEYSLIKTHAQAGYEILKGIDFPWPIAQIVLQHHERMDGSGYPQGLRGDGILLEARIISVADVVEAMSSHRPYRPSLGIEAALNEITSNRGSHFDTKVVDACLALFREQHYAFN